MPGALSLWLLSLSREQRESDSPCKAKSVVSVEENDAINSWSFGRKIWSFPACCCSVIAYSYRNFQSITLALVNAKLSR
jgi:hypothetical protein